MTNPIPDCWQAEILVPRGLAEPAEGLLSRWGGDANPPSIAAFAPEDDPSLYRVEGYFSADPDATALERHVKAALGDALLEFRCAAMAPLDWVAISQSMLEPITAGRFHVYGSHAKASLRPGQTGLLIEAAQAFGTGRHATTFGCLSALDWLRKRRRFSHALDLGCGSAVLAIAIAKAWHIPVLGNDIDPVSVKVAISNVRDNHLMKTRSRRRFGVGLATANGVRASLPRSAAPYPLIVANIFADPLRLMSRDIANATAPGGIVILSGLLSNQEAMVLAAYRRQGMRLKKRIKIGDWPTLILARASKQIV